MDTGPTAKEVPVLIEALRSMDKDDRVARLAAELKGAAHQEERRRMLVRELGSKTLDLRKDEMVALAHAILARKFPTKKAALEAIQKWSMFQSRGHEASARILKSVGS